MEVLTATCITYLLLQAHMSDKLFTTLLNLSRPVGVYKRAQRYVQLDEQLRKYASEFIDCNGLFRQRSAEDNWRTLRHIGHCLAIYKVSKKRKPTETLDSTQEDIVDESSE